MASRTPATTDRDAQQRPEGVKVRQGWRVYGHRLKSESPLEAWERAADITIAVSGVEMSLSVSAARRLARVLSDLALRVEKRAALSSATQTPDAATGAQATGGTTP